MKPNDERIKQAKKLVESKGGSPSQLEDAMYIYKGEKVERSPKEPNESNRSFFHVQNMPCTLTLGDRVYEGFLTHEDYSPFMSFVTGENKLILQSGEHIYGTKRYENWEPVHMKVTGKLLYFDDANKSLTASCL